MSQQINLLEARFRKEPQPFEARALVLALGALLALTLVIGELFATQNRSLQRTLAQSETRAVEMRAQARGLARELAAQKAGTALVDEIARLEEQLRARRALLAGMQGGVGGDTDGFSPYLVALARRSVSGVWLTGVEIGNGQLVLRGRVLDSDLVPTYIRALHQEPLFQGRTVSDLRLSAAVESRPGAQRHVEFSMRIPLDGGGA